MRKGLVVLAVAILMLVCVVGVQASGIVIFEIDVERSHKVNAPDKLFFDPVAPEEEVYAELAITVQTNAPWQLSVRARSSENSPTGTIEVGDGGDWHSIFPSSYTVLKDQPMTGAAGIAYKIPFRFIASYDDKPGTYDFQVELTITTNL